MTLSYNSRKYIPILVLCCVIVGLGTLVFLFQSDARVSIVPDSTQIRFIGAQVTIKGTCSGQDVIYLYITNPNSPDKGRTLEKPSLAVIDKNSSTFSFSRVNPDNTWIFTWDTSVTGLQPGTYTIYAGTSPRDFSHLAETKYDNISIKLKNPPSKERMKILVTGFEEFGVYSKNPSKELVQFINSVKPDGFSEHLEIRGIVLPVLYNESWNRLHEEIVQYQPDIVLSYGFYPGSDSVSLERTARNYDGGYADNNNLRHKGQVVEGGPSYYYSSLPLNDLERGLSAQGIPVRISDNAGSYICNHLFYQLMNYYHDDYSGSAGFIHIPDWETCGNGLSLSHMFNTTVSVIEDYYYPSVTS